MAKEAGSVMEASKSSKSNMMKALVLAHFHPLLSYFLLSSHTYNTFITIHLLFKYKVISTYID